MNKKTLFLVDDSAANLTLADGILSREYTVYTFNSGERMFKLLEKVRPDLILLDIEMPELDGHGVLSLLKANKETSEIPVIFLTAHNNEDSEIKGFSMGVVDYITKPFSPPRLLKRIESHLAMEAQRKELAKYSKNLEKMVEEGTQKLVTLKNVLMETMSELVEHRDMVTGGHIERTQLYVGIMLDAMIEKGVYKQEIEQIDANLARQSSQLHDIGKISVKDSILMKPGRLTEDEFEEIKQHTKFGERIIAKIQEKVVDSDFLEYAKVFAAFHHEKWDGSGYHTGLRGQDIPLLGRVMAIADVYDALTTSRPYKDAFPHEKAVDIIQKDRGTHFDPALVDLFLEFQDKFEEIANNNS